MDINIHQTRKYNNQTLHYATVTQNNKSITDWFKPFNKENKQHLLNTIFKDVI